MMTLAQFVIGGQSTLITSEYRQRLMPPLAAILAAASDFNFQRQAGY